MEIKFKDEDKENILLSSASAMTTKRKCELCGEKDSLYTCPKCNKFYCGVSCYRDSSKHLDCSESFYQEQVLGELKMLQLDDKESKRKMCEILKRNADELEDEENFLLDNKNHETEEKIDDKQLIKAYEEVVEKFQPWWLNYLSSKCLINENIEKKNFEFNQNLLKKSQNLNVKNASQLIINDIYQTFYIYTIVVYIYQLEEVVVFDAGSLSDEAAQTFLQTDKLCKSNLLKTSSVSAFLNATIQLLNENQSLHLRNLVSGDFLIGLLDEMVRVTEAPMIMFKLCSHLYSLIEGFLRHAKKNEGDEKNEEVEESEIPINVFYYNRNVKKVSNELNKKSRVQILTSKKLSSDSLEPKIKQRFNSFPVDFLKEAKFCLRKLEFYFKWLNLNQADLKMNETIGKRRDELNALKQSLIKREEMFNLDQQFIEKNLDAIRKKQLMLNRDSLIEEI